MPPMPPLRPDDDDAIAVYEGWHDCLAGDVRKDAAAPAVPPRPAPNNSLAILIERHAAKQAKQAMKQVSRSWRAPELALIEKEAAHRFQRELLGSPGREDLLAVWRQAQQQAGRLAQAWPEKEPEAGEDLYQPLRYGADLSLVLEYEAAAAPSQAAARLGAKAQALAELVQACVRYGTGPSSPEKAERITQELQAAAAELSGRFRKAAAPDLLKPQFERLAATLEAGAAAIDGNRLKLPPPNEEGYEPEEMAFLEQLPQEILEEMAEAAATDYRGPRPQRILAIAPRWIITYEQPSLSELSREYDLPYPTTVATAKQRMQQEYADAMAEVRRTETEGRAAAEALFKPLAPGFQQAERNAVQRWLHENPAGLPPQARQDLQTAVSFYAEGSEFQKMFNAKRRKEAGEAARSVCRALRTEDYRQAATELFRIVKVIREVRNVRHKSQTLAGLHHEIMRLLDSLEQLNGSRVQQQYQTGLFF